MQLHDDIKTFIEQNIDLIQQNEWDEVYTQFNADFDPESTGQLTQLLWSAGIDPLVDGSLTSVPDCYMFDAKLSECILPEGITDISYASFSHAHMNYLHLPESLERINEYAFYFSNIKKIKIYPKCTNIHLTAFNNCECVIVCKKNSFAETFANGAGLEVELF